MIPRLFCKAPFRGSLGPNYTPHPKREQSKAEFLKVSESFSEIDGQLSMTVLQLLIEHIFLDSSLGFRMCRVCPSYLV